MELGKIQQGAGGDGDNVTQVSTQTVIPVTSNMLSVTAAGNVLSQGTLQAGAGNIVTLQNNQVLLSKAEPGTVRSLQTTRRATTSAGDSIILPAGQTLTKMIITKNLGNQQSPITVSSIGGQTPTQVIVTTTAATSLLSHPQTPPKESYRVVMSNTGVFSPQKILTTPSTPTKQILPAGKLPISPLKSPTKIAMVPIAKSPQKGVPRQAQIITMMGRSVVSGIAGTPSTYTLASSRPQLSTSSPSKVIIKKQQINVVSSRRFSGMCSSIYL